ncbi:MAG: tRNA pseudouridine(55) synthase TruB [Clostridia bacterium]|nr:tRNA pseudouridine(55) synthase TruB [Clostridia bacterium]
MDGIINLCKPRGISSFRALSVVKRRLKLKKVGHLGTLDPAACGVLVLLCGRATKLTNQLHASTKVYRTLILWGQETNTLDCEGEVVATSEIIPTAEQIKTVLPTLTGEVQIEVPKFSAVHIQGKRAYELARQGIDFVPPQKNVMVTRFELLDNAQCLQDLSLIGEDFVLPPHASYFEIECQTGTYIRSLAKLLATRLETVATAAVILRTQVGNFKIEDARTLDCVASADLKPMEVYL